MFSAYAVHKNINYVSRLQCHTASEYRTKTGEKWNDKCESLSQWSVISGNNFINFILCHKRTKKTKEQSLSLARVHQPNPVQSH